MMSCKLRVANQESVCEFPKVTEIGHPARTDAGLVR